MPNCVHLSRDMVRIDAGGSTCCGNTVDVRRCLSSEQQSEYCVPHRSFEGFLSGIGDVGGERRLIKAVSCEKCDHFTRPECVVFRPPMSHTKRMWLQIHGMNENSLGDSIGSAANSPEIEPVKFHSPVKNLIFHAWPNKRGLWRMSVSDIMSRIEMFNGKVCVGISVDQDTEDPQEVVKAFEGRVDEVFVSENAGKGEMHSFPSLLQSVATTDDQHVTFYAHTKASQYEVSSELSVCGQLWGDVMRETCLGYWPIVESILETKAMAGSFKKVGWGFPGIPSDWHYSGTHYWFRNRDVSIRNHQMSDREWYGTEIWPSILFRVHQAGTVFYDGTVPELNLYSSDYWKEMVSPSLESWRNRNRDKCTSSGKTKVNYFFQENGL